MAHTHDSDHYHAPGLQHQFEDMKQQEESVSIAMWMFLVQEIMFFGGLFTVYLVFRSRYPMALGRTQYARSHRQQLDDGSDGLLRAERQQSAADDFDRPDDDFRFGLFRRKSGRIHRQI
jgi:hypothetical protein